MGYWANISCPFSVGELPVPASANSLLAPLCPNTREKYRANFCPLLRSTLLKVLYLFSRPHAPFALRPSLPCPIALIPFPQFCPYSLSHTLCPYFLLCSFSSVSSILSPIFLSAVLPSRRHTILPLLPFRTPALIPFLAVPPSFPFSQPDPLAVSSVPPDTVSVHFILPDYSLC